MKKKRVITIVILILVLSCIAGGVFAYTERKKKQEETLEKILIAIEYQRQNGTFPRTSGHYADEAFYVGYDAIRENEMYVSLMAYNEWNREHGVEAEELTLADIEEYLSAEYNEDGSLRIQSGYENIRAYVEWYYQIGGDEVIEEYWNELGDILGNYREEHPKTIYGGAKTLGIEQLQELIKKKEDPSYEINMEIMREQQ
ncbi:MAG: hypothetical protein HDR08_15315 [Lachnospiraceae bacterium]|nr:hypothetical protein [Lachnospiraceae bacterium]